MYKNNSIKKTNLDWKLTGDNNKTEYAIELQNRVNALQTQNDADTLSNNIIDTQKEAAHYQKGKEKHYVPWKNKATRVKEAQKIMSKKNTESSIINKTKEGLDTVYKEWKG